jgi:signal transduction histidine kinase
MSLPLAGRRVSWRRLLIAGLGLAAIVALAGGAFEWLWFGASEAAAAARVERHVKSRFDAMVASLETVAERIARDPAAPAAMSAGEDGARTLFALTAAARASGGAPEEIAVTVYHESFAARAWAGRPSEIPRERTAAAKSLFVTRSPLGLRLVHVQPINGADGRRVGSIAAEHVVAPAPAEQAFAAGDFSMPTPVAPASLRLRHEVSGTPRDGALLLRAPSGELLLEASVSPAAIAEVRAAWRRRTAAVAILVCGVTLLLVIGPLLDRRATARDARTFVRTTAGAAAIAVAGGLIIWLALVVLSRGLPPRSAKLLVAAFVAAAVVALLAGPVARLRVALRSRRSAVDVAAARFLATQAAAGTAVAVLLVFFQRLLHYAVDPVGVDLRHLSLYPWGDTSRIVLLGGILGVHLAVLWAGTLILAAAIARWKLPRRGLTQRSGILALWVAPSAVAAALVFARGWPFSALGLVLSAIACGVAALAGPRTVAWYRRTTVASRILALFVAFLIPSLLLYPSLDSFAERATRRLITEQYAVQAQTHPQRLQALMVQAQKDIDALTILPDLVTGSAALQQSTDSAFLVWRQTALARERLTSAVELYNAEGLLVSRFALNIPEYTVASQTAPAGAGCKWDLFGEAAPIGSEERRMLHAERRICVTNANGGPPLTAGTIVLHVVFDYRTLPFITSQSPYFELFRPSGSSSPGEAAAGRNVEIVIYGWGLRPIYMSGASAWRIDDQLFARLYGSREPFWTEIQTGGIRHRVYLSNDRAGIFAIGYPVLTLFDHFVHVAELTTLAGAAFVVVLIGTAVFTRLGRQQPRVGRALLREIRASFYRKLFLAFVLAAIIPVLTLAIVIRVYFRNLMLGDVEAEAARTAAVARRVIEESDVLSRRSAGTEGELNDDIMVWIRQVIDQDVNIFEGPRLLATSERDLFASGLLPTRTPDDVYRAVILERLPSFVSTDRIGTVPYLIAAAPVRGPRRDALLTVPLAPRQREIEQEIDELDRGVHLASLFFILLGAAIGLSMAERIADPVRRLTRATRLIARGDFDARIAVRSADELKRLVDAFNSMAAELKAQRAQLERTHRLEAWAEMARQVAHEIKNPLTPIQLSAEHLERVHADTGRPMGPVLESCVASILSQVRLLRQISGEFSNFASSPTARPTSVDIQELVAEVLAPYATGLAGRIEVRNGVPSLPRAFVDRTLIARALANIIENALYAMPAEGSLTLDARVDGDFIVLTVADTGVGMDDDALSRVFEPYFSTKTTGTGLGLPIARRNVELSGGEIDVASTRGRGTVVTLRLPTGGSHLSEATEGEKGKKTSAEQTGEREKGSS